LLTDLYESVHHNQPTLLISVGNGTLEQNLRLEDSTKPIYIYIYLFVCYVSCLASSGDISKGTYLMVG